jgi:DNA-binding NarL/FixJ family response regulator
VIRVVLVDDQPLVRAGFRAVLDREDDIAVVGEASNGQEALELLKGARADVVLMDIRMPLVDGVEATARLSALPLEPAARVIILTTFDLDEYVLEALRAGASGFLLKDVQPNDLLAAVRIVAAGEAMLAPSVTRQLLSHVAPTLAPTKQSAELESLTDRERDVLLAVARGLSNAEIAAELFVSESTVKTHLSRVLTKLGLKHRTQAAVFAYEAGLVTAGGEPPARA